MKQLNYYVLLFAILFVYTAKAQVGIGTTNPDKSSMLEIASTNSGLLIPRVTLNSTSDVTTIPNPAMSLLVYNLNTSGDITPGFYYWNGGWKSIAESSVSKGWSLKGNTIAAGDYLGTNNFSSLHFKVNNKSFADFHPNGGIAIGNDASANPNNSIAIGATAKASASNEATAIGPSANAAGYQAIALGYNSSASNNNAVALGHSAKASGYLSSSVGYLSKATANNATAIGNNATASGEQSVALGHEARVSGQNAVAIGYQATATQANSIILGNSSNANNKVGIGTNSPEERLHVVGSIKIVDGTQGANKVLTSDANGKASWVSPSALKAYADVYYSGSGQTIANNTNVTFGTTNVASNVTVNNNNIQVLTAGKYRITYKITLLKSDGGTTAVNYNLFKGNTLIPGSLATVTLKKNEQISIAGSVITTLNAYDQVAVRGTLTDSDVTLIANGCNLTLDLID